VKTESERFAGAEDTYCIEALMQDGKALQAGTSHFLGQNFAKAFDVTFLNRENQREFVWATSWGVSTRLMGALVMTHSDDQGLVLPPKLATIQVVVVPIYKNDDELAQVRDYLLPAIAELKVKGIRVKFDDDDQKRPGWKFAEHELKGVPLRLVAGPKDVQNSVLELARRDQEGKQSVPREAIAELAEQLLAEIQQNMFDRAKARLAEQTYRVDTYEAFKQQIEIGGFVLAHWDGTAETEERIKTETKATIRCIPLDSPEEAGVCILTGKPSNRRVLFAQAY